MDRITIKTLRHRVDMLNRNLGLPMQIWSPDPSGRGNVAHVGCYSLDCAYGGYCLVQIVSASGGERDITPRVGAGECLRLINAFEAGLERARK